MFFKEVDLTDRKAMIFFLANHFRYYTINPWNRLTSYANNVKLQNLEIPNHCKRRHMILFLAMILKIIMLQLMSLFWSSGIKQDTLLVSMAEAVAI